MADSKELARIRTICLALPGGHEVEAWGEPTFRVKNKIFAYYADKSTHHGFGRTSVWFKAAPGDQELLVRADPDRFFAPPYVGPKGWVGVHLDKRVSWKTVAAMAADSWRMTAPKKLLASLPAALALLLAAAPLAAQTDGTCIPVAERAGRELGCFITARQELGALPADTALYWHVDRYADSATAARFAGLRSTVVTSLGATWLFSIEPRAWRPRFGARVRTIGPLPLVGATSYAATYMEGVFAPGMVTVVHRHPGAEAWVTLEGAMCVETPAGRQEQGVDGPDLVVPGGTPMRLSGIGTATRRSLVLILQDSAQPRSTPAHDWVPAGLCR